MTSAGKIWAVLPVKETGSAKQRLAELLPARLRQALALTMLEDVLRAVVSVSELAGAIVVTVDREAAGMAQQFGAEVWTDDACAGHTRAVMGAARRLASQDATMLTLPGDIPLVTPDDIRFVLQAHTGHQHKAGFTIVPARDELGSNTILTSPADLVPLRFGPDSFFPHLDAARQQGVEPVVVRRHGISLDIDEPADIEAFMRIQSATRTRLFLNQVQGEFGASRFAGAL